MNDNAFGIRDGEIAIELPAKFDASLYFIGRIRTPWRRREDCPKNARESDAVCTLEVDERWAQALTGVETCSHLVVLYWMSRSRRDLVLQVPRHYGVGRGTLALRSPARPNPIAMSVVRLSRVEGTKLSVVGLDCLDEEAQMAGNARLRLAQDGGEIGDGEFRLPQQCQDAQPSGLSRGLERPVERLERQVGRRGHRCGPGSHFGRWRRCQASI